MVTVTNSVLRAMEEARMEWDTRRRTIIGLARLLNVSQSELGRRVGMSRQAVNQRLTGQVVITPWEMVGFALALDLPLEVVSMSPDAAMRWVIDHPAALPEDISRAPEAVRSRAR